MTNREIVPNDVSDCTGSAAFCVSGHGFSRAAIRSHPLLILHSAGAVARDAAPAECKENDFGRSFRARLKPCPGTKYRRIYGALYDFALLAALLLAPITASADGGVVRVRQASGPFLISIFTPSDPLRAGPIDVSVLVQDGSSGDPILDATVNLAIQTLDSDRARFLARATHQQATNKLLQAATVKMPAAGRWVLRVEVRRGRDEATLTTEVRVGPPAPRLAAIWPYLLLPPFAIAVFALHQALRQDALHRARSSESRLLREEASL